MDYISPLMSRRVRLSGADAVKAPLQRLRSSAQEWSTAWNEALADEDEPRRGTSSLALTQFYQATRPATGRVSF